MVTDIIRKIYGLTAELEKMYPGRHFTPDGHMLGSNGEVYAAEKYGLTLYPASHKTHDAVDGMGRQVQIKITQTDRVALTDCPEWLIVLKIDREGILGKSITVRGLSPGNCPGKSRRTDSGPST